MLVEEFLAKLRNGGAIVSSNDCSEMELADARTTGRFFVDSDNYGYVWRTPEWLKSREEAFFDTERHTPQEFAEMQRLHTD